MIIISILIDSEERFYCFVPVFNWKRIIAASFSKKPYKPRTKIPPKRQVRQMVKPFINPLSKRLKCFNVSHQNPFWCALNNFFRCLWTLFWVSFSAKLNAMLWSVIYFFYLSETIRKQHAVYNFQQDSTETLWGVKKATRKCWRWLTFNKRLERWQNSSRTIKIVKSFQSCWDNFLYTLHQNNCSVALKWRKTPSIIVEMNDTFPYFQTPASTPLTNCYLHKHILQDLVKNRR